MVVGAQAAPHLDGTLRPASQGMGLVVFRDPIDLLTHVPVS